ncbi:hypothetical protein [Paucidesulfovibrio longus]|uniref:hypothetical protein n=1 Tax=Paucidesulfovibrio longus TaxID=889 RepID=UPI0009DB82C6|nr:hypothetical protein [Paucidesulfovibrio longus]
MENIRQELIKHLPPLFAGTSLDRLTGDALRWRTIQNLRSQKKIPGECFVRQGSRKVLVVRDLFVDWWMGQID